MLESGEAVGVGYHIFVMWRTVGADMVFLNEEAVEETHDNVTSRYCYWKVLYADQVIYNDKDGYKTEDKELCKVTHYGHSGAWSGQLFDGKLKAIGFRPLMNAYHCL